MTVESSSVQAAVEALQGGKPVLVYDADGREEETDLVWASQFVTPEVVHTLRTDGGGLICTTLAPEVHQALGLPYLHDVLAGAVSDHPVLGPLTDSEVKYEAAGNQRPSFGLSINHRDTYTGVTDADRSLTIRRMADLAADAASPVAAKAFAAEFKAPGHVFLLNAHPEGLAARRGHTELATALVTMAGLAPSATICEMMNGPSGRALPKGEAIKYAAQNGHAFLTGDEVVAAWQAWNKKATDAPSA